MSPTHEKQHARSMVTDLAIHFTARAPDIESPPDCLPFPAGPLLPREETLMPALIPHGLFPRDRIELAYSLFPKDKGEQHGLDKEYLGLTWRLHTLSCFTWGQLHGRPLVTPGPQVNVEAAVFKSWASLLTRQSSDLTEEAFRLRRDKPLELLLERLNDTSQRSSKAAKGRDRLENVYTPPQYTCRCHPGGRVSGPRVKIDQELAATGRVACKADPWGMLQRFWFKQLHSHHTQAWDLGLSLKYILPYHRAALGVLHALRRQPSHPLAPVARALTVARLLPPSNPKLLKAWYQRLGSPLWTTTVWPEGRPLPSALCPGTLGIPSNDLAAMLEIRAEMGLSERVVRAVDTLAREVASLLTDPWVATQLAWKKEEVDALQRRLNEESKPRKRSEFLELMDHFHQFPDVLNRRRATQKCLQWAVQDWHVRSNAAQTLLADRNKP